MKVTFILKDLSEEFYNGFAGIIGLLNMDNKQKFNYLRELKCSLAKNITMKIGNSNQFRDVVELNSILRNESTFDFKIEPRKGYKLITFEIVKINA